MRATTWMMLVLVFLCLPALTWAQEEEDDEDDIEVFGFELEEVLALGSGALAIALAGITAAAYKRSGNKRLLFITLAFGLFAFKLLMEASELFMDDPVWMDPVSALLDFVILLSFFWGVLKR